MTYVIIEDLKLQATKNTSGGWDASMAKSLEFVFQFPPIQGVFDTGYGIVYIFGEVYENQIEDIITHETLHYAVQKLAGKRASLRLDRVYDRILSD